MPETPFTGLIRSLRAASNPWERLRLIASGARTLGALPQRQRRALVRNLGLAGAEDLVDRLAGDDEEVVAAFRGALDRIGEDPGSVERLLDRLRDPKTRRETLLGLFGHLEEAVQEEVEEKEKEEREKKEEQDRDNERRPAGPPETPRRDDEERTTEPEEVEVKEEGEAEVRAEAGGEPKVRGTSGTVDRSPRPPERPPQGVESEVTTPVPPPAPPSRDEPPAVEEGAPSRPASRPSSAPAGRPPADRSPGREPRREIPEEELHTDRPEGPSDRAMAERIATPAAPTGELRAAPGASSARGRGETPTSPGARSVPALPTREQPPGTPCEVKGTELLRRLRSFRDELETGEISPKSLAARLERIPAGWPRRRALEAAIRGGAAPGLAATLGLMEALLSPSDRIWCLTALAETRTRTDDDWDRLLDAAPNPATRRRLELRRSAAAGWTGER